MTDTPDTTSPAAILYPSAKPDALAATPGSTTPKTAATTPAPAASASPGTTPQPATKAADPRSPAAALYGSPMRDIQEAVAATPIPNEAAEHFDMGEEGKAAREAVRSAFLASGASAAETSELWGIAVDAARPDAAMPDHDAARAELMAAWGDNYTARLASVRTFFKGVAQKHPAVATEVRKLGLDNSPRFLMALHKAAQRRGR